MVRSSESDFRLSRRSCLVGRRVVRRLSWSVWRTRRTFLCALCLALGFGNLSTFISLYLRHRGMTSPPAPAQGSKPYASVSFTSVTAYSISFLRQRSSGCLHLVVSALPDHNPSYLPLRLGLCFASCVLPACHRVQIWLSLFMSSCVCCAYRSHRKFTLGALCMGLLGPCGLNKFFPWAIHLLALLLS